MICTGAAVHIRTVPYKDTHEVTMVIQILEVASSLSFRSAWALCGRARGAKTRKRVTVWKRGQGEERKEIKKFSHRLEEERC